MNGKALAVVFRIFALLTAVVLGGLYVWTRQKQAAPPPVVPPRVEGVPESDATVTELKTTMPGTKSAILLPLHESGGGEGPKGDGEQRIVLPGSKSIDSILRPEDVVPSEGNQEEDRTEP
jgi:hypothetical protein